MRGSFALCSRPEMNLRRVRYAVAVGRSVAIGMMTVRVHDLPVRDGVAIRCILAVPVERSVAVRGAVSVRRRMAVRSHVKAQEMIDHVPCGVVRSRPEE